MNRVKQSIKQMKKTVVKHIGLEIIDTKKSDLDLKMFDQFVDLLNLAEKGKKLSLEEIESVKKHLGTNPNFFNAKPLHIKLVLLNLFNELLHMRHKAVTHQYK